MALGGVPATGGAFAAGGVVGTGGSSSGAGGVVGNGGTRATGGATGTGGTSGSGGVGGAGGATSDGVLTSSGGVAGKGGVAGTGGSVGTGGIVGTGGSSTGGGGSCSNVPACGGDVVGTWTVTSSCLSVAGQMDMAVVGLSCTSATVTGSLQVTGTWTANANGTYSDNTTTSGNEHLTLPAACLRVSGVTITCDRIGAVLLAAGYASVICTSAASGGCTCSATVNQNGWMAVVSPDVSTSGEYTTSGTVVTLDSEAKYSFCASGNQLNMTPQGTSPTAGTVVLQKSGSTGSGGAAGSGIETSPDAGCVNPTVGSACSATSVVCSPNGCCGLYFVCVNGEWDYGSPCPCY